MDRNLIPVVGQPVLDAESVRRLRQRIGSWFAILFILSLLIPALISMSSNFFSIKTKAFLPYYLSRSVFWQGKLWFVSGVDEDSQGRVLKCVDFPSFSSSTPIAAIPCGYGRLLPGNNELWLPARNRPGVFRDGHFSEFPAKVLQPVDKNKNSSVMRSQYFLYGGQPARIEGELGEWHLIIWQNDDWVRARTFAMPEFVGSEITQTLLLGKPLSSLPRFDGMNRLSQAELDIRCHLYQDSLYVLLAVPDPALNGIYCTSIPLTSASAIGVGKTWHRLDFDDLTVFPLILGDTFYLGGKSCSDDRVNFYALKNGAWKNAFSYKLPDRSTGLLTVFSGLKQNQICLIQNETIEDLLTTVELDLLGKEVNRFEINYSNWWQKNFEEYFGYLIAFLFAIFALIALIAISNFNKKMVKVQFHDLQGNSFQTATIIRRIIALFVDIFILLVPLSAPFIIGIISVDQVKNSFIVMFMPLGYSEVLSNFYLLGYIAYATVILVLFSWLEEHYTASPGKMLLCLRLVDEQGRPCGFKQILLRNMIKFVIFFPMPFYSIIFIGVFFFLALTAAFSEQGQHLGDLAVSSLVLRKLKAPRSTPITD